MTPLTRLDFSSPRFKANPHPTYARLRRESPICRVKLPDRRLAWMVFRYDDALAVLKDERFVKDPVNAGDSARQAWVPALFKPLLRNMLDLDPPDHTRLKKLVHQAFTPRFVEKLRRRVESLTQELLDAAGDRYMDLIRDYALPLPTTIIAEMLGVPEADHMKFHRWSKRIVAADASRWAMLKAIPSGIAFLRYIRKLICLRRSNPGDDLVSRLTLAQEVDDSLSDDELMAMVFLLLVAGHETTVNLIGNGMLSLLLNPEQLQRLRQAPSLMESAVEELLRFDGPLETATERFAREEISMGGVTIARGDLVIVVIASANRDEGQFQDPDRLELSRQPNQHLSFGQGIHYCLGAPLARMEGQIALKNLLQRHPQIELGLPLERLRRRPGLVLRGLSRLPLRFEDRST